MSCELPLDEDDKEEDDDGDDVLESVVGSSEELPMFITECLPSSIALLSGLILSLAFCDRAAPMT